MSYLDALNWRYATKKLDPSKPVPADTVDRILEAARMAPTSSRPRLLGRGGRASVAVSAPAL